MIKIPKDVHKALAVLFKHKLLMKQNVNSLWKKV